MTLLDLDAAEELFAAIDRGQTLPFSWYDDPEIFRLERDRIFKRSWQFFGYTFELAEPGDMITGEIAGVPIVVTRGTDGELHGLVNICPHRGSVVVSEPGRRMTMQCRYHGWTFELDGSLRAAPRSDREPDFEPSSCGLRHVRVDALEPLVFVNLEADAQPLREWMGPMVDVLEHGGLDLARLRRFDDTGCWDIQGNWKAYSENTNECYHCTINHATFRGVFDLGAGGYRQSCLTSGMLTAFDAVEGVDLAPSNPTGQPTSTVLWPYLWPNLKIYPQVDGDHSFLGLAWWIPVTASRTILKMDTLFLPEAPPQFRAESLAFSFNVLDEDVALVESVQRGMSAGVVPHGRLLSEPESGIQHFARLVLAALTERSVPLPPRSDARSAVNAFSDG